MKKIFFINILSVSLLLGVSYSMAAGTIDNQSTNRTQGTVDNTPKVQTLDNPLKVESIGDLVQSGLQVFTYIAVIIGVIMFVVVGLQYILAMGNAEKMKTASKWLLSIVIGVAIVIGARVAVSIVINTLSATGVVNPKVIQSAKNAIK